MHARNPLVWDKRSFVFGYMRRGGDGKDVKWIKGPARGMST